MSEPLQRSADFPSSEHPLPVTGLLADFRLLLYLFVVFRLALMVVYQPGVVERYAADGTLMPPVERGLSTYGDLRYYYRFAQMTDQGLWPYRDFWFEFPPVWSTLYIGLFHIMSARGTVTFGAWAAALGMLLMLCDIGNLLLLRRLARRLHGDHVALALSWIYALLVVPVVMPWWTFEPLVVLLLLLTLWWLLVGHARRSALAVALGILTKFIAVLVLPAVWRMRNRNYAIRYTLIAVVAPVLVFGGMLVWGGAMARASLVAQANKASYQTVWALVDGNFDTGRFAPPDQRTDPDTAYDLSGSPPAIPAWARLIPFVALGGWIYHTTTRRDDIGLVAFVTVTLVLFFLWAQGWSPQWALTLTPLILLNFPSRAGVLACLVLGLISFLEYPGLFARTVAGGGVLTGDLRLVFAALVLLRTGLLVGLAAALVGQLHTVGEALREGT